ncbi:hypothetical protein [Streptomyces atroolivaceus]|uniref:hypothetical protein n=1 Tax=Streptomyces atroolivaceus TaxID=66869 RepID=UPI0037A1821E
MSHPQSYEILLFPEPEESATGTPAPGTAIRSAVVAATGDTGTSGYPRYAGEGMVADIDPASHTVEALLVDGAELDYGLTVRVAEHIGGTEEPETEEPETEEPKTERAEPAGGGQAPEPTGEGQAPGTPSAPAPEEPGNS